MTAFLLLALAFGLLLAGAVVFTNAARREQSQALDIHAPTTARDLLISSVFLLIALVLGIAGPTWVLAKQAGVSPLILALVLAPLATELPEKANSIIWSRRGQDALALGNITGALVFQSMPVVAVGLAFTPWSLTAPSIAAIGCAVVGIWLALAAVWRRRRFAAPAMGGWAALYGGFLGYVMVTG